MVQRTGGSRHAGWRCGRRWWLAAVADLCRSPNTRRTMQTRLPLLLSLCIVLTSCDSKQASTSSMTPANQSDDKGLFLSWQHPVSKRTAILEELGCMVWLYLTAADTNKPERDCPVYSTVPLADKVDWIAVRESGAPPPLSKDVASSEAFVARPVAGQFEASWSSDGQSVALFRSGRCIAMIVAGVERGHSRALAVEGPLGLPFDEDLASATFHPPKH